MNFSSGLKAIPSVIGIATTLMVAGCSPRPADEPPLGRVRGTVTMDGQPLAGVDVVFAPKPGRPSMATTDKAGRYDLWYINRTMGAKVGPHRVFIRPSDMASDDPSAEGTSGGAPAMPRPRIPAKYNKRSELTAEVKAGSNTIDFALDSK